MKIIFFNFKKCARYLAVFLTIIALFTIAGLLVDKAIIVLADRREIPIYSVDCSENKVSITFDCAWGASDIPSILETLKEENIKATFFVVGMWAEKYPDSVKMIAEEGHEVANHSYSHLRMGVLDSNRTKQEISKCTEVIERLTGKTTNLFRAPYGDYNNNVISTAKDMGYYSIQWDVDSLDWKPEISKETILNRVVNNVKKGSIILFHNDTKYTAEVLPSVIKALKEKGYKFVPVSELIYKDNYTIDATGRQSKKSK